MLIRCQVLKTAVETSVMLLRIDDIVSGQLIIFEGAGCGDYTLLLTILFLGTKKANGGDGPVKEMPM